MGKKFHAMHGRDHAPGGSDPITGLDQPALVLWGSHARMGDANYTIPAYTGSGGAFVGIPYARAVEPADKSWYTFKYNGSTVTTPPYDTVVISKSGTYFVSAYTELVDSGHDAWFGAGIVCTNTNVSTSPIQFFNDVHQVHAAGGGTPAMSEDGSDGTFLCNAVNLIESGQTGTVYVQVWHQDNRTVTVSPEQTLTIVKLS